MWDALERLRAERIGHGTSSARDPELLPHLAERRIALEVRPTSNIATRAVTTLDEHPVKEFARAGVLVTINSDNPPMFGTDLNNEYAVAARLLGLDERGLADLAKNAVQASFIDPPGKARLAAEIDTYTTTWLAPTAPPARAAMQNLTAVAHRGDPYRLRENTLASLRSALHRGADAVETDVRLTHYVPVLLHDETLYACGTTTAARSLSWRGGTRSRRPGAGPRRRADRDRRQPPDDRPARRSGRPGRAPRRGRRRARGAGPRLLRPGAPAMLAVRAADPSAEIAPPGPRAPPRAALLPATPLAELPLQPGGPDPRRPRPPRRPPALRLDPDTRRSMRRLRAWASTRSPPTASTSCAHCATAPDGAAASGQSDNTHAAEGS
ncbi:Adenine deaminase [Streptomyces griseoloalbus]